MTSAASLDGAPTGGRGRGGGRGGGGTVVCGRSTGVVSLLLCACLSLAGSVASCPPSCLCASDIVSCSGRDLSAFPSGVPRHATLLDLSHNALGALLRRGPGAETFHRLATLILSRNVVEVIERDAFALTPHLRHLDLSSNRLQSVNASAFGGLERLEVLLLFSNQIVQLNAGAFAGLLRLQRLYLSGNKLTAFPLEPYRGAGGPANLTFLDLSSNGISRVPVESLLSLTSAQQSGVYLQGNPLVCDCALLALLEFWAWKQYRPLVDFGGEYPCGLGGDGGGEEPNCPGSWQEASNEFLAGGTHQIEPGDWLNIPCPGLVAPLQGEPAVFWVTPRGVLRASASDPMDRLAALPNGTLEIRGARLEDFGTYECVVARGHRWRRTGDSPEVRVRVGNASVAGSENSSRSAEHFNTAFTTLASCVVSIILVLLYLYLTPCRCYKTTGGGAAGGCGGRAILLCSDPREVDTKERRPNGKRVAFLEPGMEDSEKCGPKVPPVNLAHTATEGILKNGSRAVVQTSTDPAHML
ncbi:amphoterin-induced protein 2-like [Lampris incognitus]|uniref:amphoterin-induced protein 2-like n=1 Tax=Lampris incognitus TaxID=2546036 RepID=UPI0024B5A90D|nr:amphoterin-induced protein 2-like [Lampris incognitus]